MTTARRARVAPDGLVGREGVVARLVASVDEGAGAVLRGPRGRGCSAVLAEAARRLRSEGRTTVVLDAVGGPERPFGALHRVLPAPLPDGVAAATLAQVVDAVVGPAPTTTDGPRPVVVVDELDAVDDGTSAVLHHAVTSGRARLLATVRDDPGGADASLAWWRDIVARVELPALDRDGSDELVERLAGGPVDASTRERLWLLARGHPGWLVAAVGATRAAGAWAREAGLWCLTGDLAATADPEVLAQVDALPAEVRAVLEALALADHLTIDDAEALGGSGPLADAERRGLVRVDEGRDGGLWCAVASRLVATALGATRDPAQATAAWRRLADVLGRSTSTADETVMTRGLALVGAGWADPPRHDDDRDALVRAAEAAFGLSRWEDCVTLAERAWRAGAGGAALQVLTVSLGHLGDPSAIAALSDDLDGLDLDDEAVVSHSDTIAISQFHANDPERAFATAARAREAAPARRPTIDVFESRLRSFGGDQATARALVEPLVDHDDVEIAIDARTVAASVDMNEGATAAAIDEFDRVFALASASPGVHVSAVGITYLFRLGALAEAGRLEEAIDGALAVERATAAGGDPASHGWLALHLGRAHLRAGQPRTAARWFGEAVSDLRRVHRPGWLAHPAAGLVAAHAALGDLAAAREAHAAWAELPAHAVAIFRPEELRYVAWLDAAEGQDPAPRLRDAIELARAAGMVPYEAAAWHDLARLGDPDDRVEAADRLAEVAERTDSRLVATHARRARAAVDGDVGGLAVAAAAYESMGAGFDAIETWAEVARQAGDEREGAQARRRVGDLAAGGEGLHTPLLGDLDAHPVLTDREAEIAAMVVAGASRQDIADHLVVSVRTIDSHLQRVYRKLGVRGRDGLVEAMGGQ
ncbi:MAG TPA: helix-turn-helix transcriptional regulator [Iamia sp.]